MCTSGDVTGYMCTSRRQRKILYQGVIYKLEHSKAAVDSKQNNVMINNSQHTTTYSIHEHFNKNYYYYHLLMSVFHLITYIHVYMLGAMYGFSQSMDCAAQTMDPYFVRAIHGLHIHVRLKKK